MYITKKKRKPNEYYVAGSSKANVNNLQSKWSAVHSFATNRWNEIENDLSNGNNRKIMNKWGGKSSPNKIKLTAKLKILQFTFAATLGAIPGSEWNRI